MLKTQYGRFMKMKYVTNHYNNIATKYCDKTKEISMSYWLDKFLYHITDVNPKIIDFGCGSGRDIKYLIDKGYKNVIGIDSSDKIVEYAMNFVGNNNIINQDSLTGFNNMSVHGIWASASLIHLVPPELDLFIDQSHMVLKKNSVLYCSFKDYNSIINDDEKKICYIISSKEHIKSLFLKKFECICDSENISIMDNTTRWFNFIFKKI